MVLKPSSTFREKPAVERFASGDVVFRFFIALAVLGCLWTTVVHPRLPALMHWLEALLS